MGLKRLSPKKKNNISPYAPKIVDQSAVSHPMTPYFFLSSDTPGCENRCPTPISISYMSPPGDNPLGKPCYRTSGLYEG